MQAFFFQGIVFDNTLKLRLVKGIRKKTIYKYVYLSGKFCRIMTVIDHRKWTNHQKWQIQTPLQSARLNNKRFLKYLLDRKVCYF
uniref:Uncharacterized protein n=1 Tax=Halalkalibacterium halodurans TaxID=86665 RepID=A0A0M0KBY5_ALKHA